MTENTNTGSVALDTAVKTAEALAPAILAAGVAADPKASAALQLAPVAIAALQNLTHLTQAGAMTPEQLATFFATVGQGIKQTHDAWISMNVPPVAPAAVAAPAAAPTGA